MKRILYFGNFDRGFSRNRIYANGLERAGNIVEYCVDNSKGLIKFINLFKGLYRLRNKYDFMIVGYPGYIIVPFARMYSVIISILTISKRKPIIFDALCTSWESEKFSHKAKYLKQILMKIIDYVAVFSSDYILVETNAQREFFINRFGNNKRYYVAYTGVNEEYFYKDLHVSKLSNFTVLFRGRLSPEANVQCILKAAKILEDRDIYFRIIGFGEMEKEVKEMINILNLKKVQLISEKIQYDKLRKLMLECNVSLGQFSNSERLKRTIPHKAFESMIMNIPYITAKADGISEIMKDGVNCIMVEPDNSIELAESILRLKDNDELSRKISINVEALFKEKFSSDKLVKVITDIINEKNN